MCDEFEAGTPRLGRLCRVLCEAQGCEMTLDAATGEVWFGANCEPSSPRLLARYNRRARPDDPPLPCVDVIQEECPCWTEAEFDAIREDAIDPVERCS